MEKLFTFYIPSKNLQGTLQYKPCIHYLNQGRIQAWSLGRATKKEIRGSGGITPKKIFRSHALQTLGKRGKRPFYFILDHEAYHSIFILPDIQTGIFVQNVMGDQLGK